MKMYGNNKNDRILIKDLEVFCHHGLHQEEKVLGQKFIVSIILYVSTRKAGLSDYMNDSVSYGDVCRLVKKEMTKQNDDLLERVAERIARVLLLEFDTVDRIKIEIKKPWAPVLMHMDYAAVSIERGWHRVYVGVGSNLGDRHAHLAFAKDQVRKIADCRNFRASDLIETAPYGYEDQRDFLNAVFAFDTLLTPDEVFAKLMEIEQEAGRERKTHWGPRTLDLDLLLYDDLITEEKHLVIPHPDMHRRSFVLDPLCQLNPYGFQPLYRERFIDLKRKLDKNTVK